MIRRDFTAALAVLSLTALASQRVGAQGLAGISNLDAAKGLRVALETGAVAAVQLLGRQDGFLGSDKFRIPLPGYLQDASKILTMLGQGRQVQELEVAMNRAAEQAVPMAKNLLVGAVKNMSVQDAKAILTGGDTSVTTFFADKTRSPLTTSFLPVVKRATSRVQLTEKADRLAQKAQAFGLVRMEDPSIDHYVTRKALDALYVVIGEEERKIRRDPVGTGSAILQRVFGAMR
ncbi:MAG: DUF4197 domain-containing protein [Comamonadaceae bacterium]|nr:MAG: DUF4197 domain-containing protein [Comamonadaceae bacterium]